MTEIPLRTFSAGEVVYTAYMSETTLEVTVRQQRVKEVLHDKGEYVLEETRRKGRESNMPWTAVFATRFEAKMHRLGYVRDHHKKKLDRLLEDLLRVAASMERESSRIESLEGNMEWEKKYGLGRKLR